jgi:hypothetical protein
MPPKVQPAATNRRTRSQQTSTPEPNPPTREGSHITVAEESTSSNTQRDTTAETQEEPQDSRIVKQEESEEDSDSQEDQEDPSYPEDPEDPEDPSTPINKMAEEDKSSKTYKPAEPKHYDGSTDLEAFLMQTRIYLRFNQDRLPKEPDKVLAASQFLTGAASVWFLPFFSDFVEKEDQASEETKYVFSDYSHFEEKLRAMFGEHNKAQRAEAKLHTLRQKTSVTAYATEFRQVAAESKLPEVALFHPFRNGLKPSVKDEIWKVPRPDKFDKYVEQAILIDQLSFERYLEKKGSSSGTRATAPNRGNKKGKSKEVNSTTTTPKEKAPAVCYNCGKPGHFSRDCRSPRKNRDSTERNPQRYQNKNNHRKGGIPQPQRKARVISQEDDEEHEASVTSHREFTIAAATKDDCDTPTPEDCTVCSTDTFQACPDHPGQPESILAITLGCTCHYDQEHCSMHSPTPSEASSLDTPTSNSDCRYCVPNRSCRFHVDSKESIEALKKGCMCYAPVVCDLHPDDLDDSDTEYSDTEEEEDPKHALMSWTVCYDDHCQIHKSDKDGSGWYPKKPRQKKKRTTVIHQQPAFIHYNSPASSTKDTTESPQYLNSWLTPEELRTAELRNMHNQAQNYKYGFIRETRKHRQNAPYPCPKNPKHWKDCRNDKCTKHAQQKSRAWRLLVDTPKNYSGPRH